MTLHAQAGAIAVMLDGAAHKFLVVTSKQNPTDWIFPKGQIEAGEMQEQAARRELQEESGFDGVIDARVGGVEYVSRRGPAFVEYFLAFAKERTGEGDGRRFEWLTYAEARERLTHEDSRRLLDAAVKLLDHPNFER
jgi:8-oxo-(d)GTP phosphatase